jgi:hypothetical protein
VHGAAVAIVLSFDGITVPWVPPELLDEPPELDDDSVHGGTISVVRLLFAGTTSWFCGLEPPPLELPPELLLEAPPGVSSTVLDGGGELEPPLDPPLDPLDPELLWHG